MTITKTLPMYIAVRLMNTVTKRCVWLNLPAIKTEFSDVINTIGAEKGNFKIAGYHRCVPGLELDTLMDASLSVINHFASRLNKLTDADLLKLCAIGDSLYSFNFMWQYVNFTYKPHDYTLLLGIRDAEALGDYYLGKQNTNLQGAKFRQCVDRREYGRKLAEIERGAFTSLGYIKSKDEWSLERKTRSVPDSLDLRGYLSEDLYGDWDYCEW